MFADQDLRMVHAIHAALRDEADQRRLVNRVHTQEKAKPRTRRVFGLRFSFA